MNNKLEIYCKNCKVVGEKGLYYKCVILFRVSKKQIRLCDTKIVNAKIVPKVRRHFDALHSIDVLILSEGYVTHHLSIEPRQLGSSEHISDAQLMQSWGNNWITEERMNHSSVISVIRCGLNSGIDGSKSIYKPILHKITKTYALHRYNSKSYHWHGNVFIHILWHCSGT